jgi:DNA helicase II / ATP-dependent DNA helicase PcrA
MATPFTSYSHLDMTFTERLIKDLKANGIPVFWDGDNVVSGIDWDDQVEKILGEGHADCVLYIASENSFASKNVKNELAFAIDHGISRIIPLIIVKGCNIPLIIVRKSRIDFTDYDAGLKKLLNTLVNTASATQQETEEEPASGQNYSQSTLQQTIARETKLQTRLIAGPGCGKTAVIEARVKWLLEQGVDPKTIYVTTFTNQAAADLKRRIVRHCGFDYPQVRKVTISTLHSLALKILRRTGRLGNFPTEPHILDNWETESIVDEEYKNYSKRSGIGICREIRLAAEAVWSGSPPIPRQKGKKAPPTPADIDEFLVFMRDFSRFYSAILPGQLVQQCLEEIISGNIDPIEATNMKELIVDEFQDLNQTDTRFVRIFTDAGVRTFVAGDDDQCIYAFRHSYPEGIISFVDNYPLSADFTLDKSYRCTPAILQLSQKFIRSNLPRRIPKTISSNLIGHQPPIDGIVHNWIFSSGSAEANAIANSCKSLIEAGIPASEIMILLANRSFLADLDKAFGKAGVLVELPTKSDGYADSKEGRLVYALLNMICDTDLKDYVAHRTLLEYIKGVGAATCRKIQKTLISQSRNFMEFFYTDITLALPPDLQGIHDITIEVCQTILTWTENDKLTDRQSEIRSLILKFGDQEILERFNQEISNLPLEATLGELRSYIKSSTEYERKNIQANIHRRLDPENISIIERGVRVMTMHSAKV